MEVVNTTSVAEPINYYNTINSYIMSPVVIIIFIIIIISYFIFSSYLGSNDANNSSFSKNNGITSNIITIIIFIILAILILVNGLQYFFSINVKTYIQGLFSPQKSIDIVIDQSKYKQSPVPEIRFKKQVFNIPGNYYNYENAKALCKAYGAELATYEDMENAYNDGAEWCNYGWSSNQLALFPTQKKTYDNLQKIQGHENDCGRPGINGGYIANPNVLFGVNCYGHKPKITSEEEELMKKITPYPETMKDIAFQKRIDFWKNHIDNILVSPFNYKTWGQL